MGKKFSFVLGAFLGAAAGAAAGIMLAPRAGAESRAMAADAMNDAWDTAVDGYERGTKTVADKVAEVAAASGISSDELREKVDAARVRMDELRTSLSDAVATASAQVVDVMNTVTEHSRPKRTSACGSLTSGAFRQKRKRPMAVISVPT